METLGKKLKSILEEKGISQEEAAEKAEFPLETFLSFTDDKALPSLDMILKLSKALDIPMRELLKKGFLPKSFIPESGEEKKSSQKVLKINITHNGGNVKLNIPYPAVKMFVDSNKLSLYLEGKYKDSLKNINWQNILVFIEKGVMGNLLEADTPNCRAKISIE